MQQAKQAVPDSSLDGLWVVLVNQGEHQMADFEGRVPMMARAGDDQTYLLGFKNVLNARKFLATSEIDGAEPRMVVRSNKDQVLNVARANGVVGVLVDYDPATQQYAAAAKLY